ncbi:DNA primase [Methanocaldococcus villosus KIN24-T80]|uniref:DNA primase DnaG n=1 Tax=Methanocaldococcus villosus KIN24-T80 TaxID=1069083 RepID=N6VZ92_9EURY|nr:DNA primase DnaG [Methanocaldococcus villosus]ENN96442.1 DNA primase [Methanocaldococcus villosus KIN24-T80]
MDYGTTKYIIYAELIADGYVEKNDIIGAIFGQTEGLLGEEFDLRELQKSGRIGRIEVELTNINGKSIAKLTIPSSLDRVETSILAAALETVDRVGPCMASLKVVKIEDIRIKKREYIIDRAKEILKEMMSNVDINRIIEEVKESVRMSEIIEYGEDKLPAGPDIDKSDEIIIVEGKADVLNLLRYGIRNAIAVEGASVPKTIIELSKKKITTAFTDGDRGGELILKELLQSCDIDYIARAPLGREVEELTKKEIIKCLKSRIPVNSEVKSIEVESLSNNDYNNYANKLLSLKDDEVIIIINGEEKKIKINELSNLDNIDTLLIKTIDQKTLDNIYNKINNIICLNKKIVKKPSNVSIMSIRGLTL